LKAILIALIGWIKARPPKRVLLKHVNRLSVSLGKTLKGVLNPNLQPFSFELNKK